MNKKQGERERERLRAERRIKWRRERGRKTGISDEERKEGEMGKNMQTTKFG